MELLAPHERSLPAPPGAVIKGLGAALGHPELDKPITLSKAPEEKEFASEGDVLTAQAPTQTVEGMHPVEWLETKGKDRRRAEHYADIERRYGYGCAMNEFLKVDLCRGIRRLGGLPSHNLSYEVLSDNIDSLMPHDIYTRPENSVYVRGV